MVRALSPVPSRCPWQGLKEPIPRAKPRRAGREPAQRCKGFSYSLWLKPAEGVPLPQHPILARSPGCPPPLPSTSCLHHGALLSRDRPACPFVPFHVLFISMLFMALVVRANSCHLLLLLLIQGGCVWWGGQGGRGQGKDCCH